MTKPPDDDTPSGNKRLFWTAAAFYALIAFEFFYMASPFAAYFYSVYGPGMDVLQRLPLADWTLWFFLPHVVADTRSALINAAEGVGLVLFFGGLVAFAVGAFQVYRAKLIGVGAVTGGVYRRIRHPQYSALILASLGMLLIWPRFLVLFSTAFVVLAYVLLARSEERACLRAFPDYAEYMTRTGMFFPRLFKVTGGARFQAVGGLPRMLAVFAGMVVLGTAVAMGLRSASIGSLYTVETEIGVFLSVASIEDTGLEALALIVMADDEVRAAIDAADAEGRVLAYVLPTTMYVSEIPMHLPPGETFGHSVPRDADPDQWKVIVTRAEFGAGQDGSQILWQAVNKLPLIEAHIELSAQRIVQRLPPPQEAYYGGMQVPVF
jgi:protein-S-isoprenylcysteine O-methyltransferase Ste14